MKCTHCRRTIPEDSFFCPYCGLVVEKDHKDEEKAIEIIGETKVISKDDLEEQLKALDRDWDRNHRMDHVEREESEEDYYQSDRRAGYSYDEEEWEEEDWDDEHQEWDPDDEWTRKQSAAERREYYARRPGKKSKKHLVLIGGVILVMAMMILLIWLVFSALDAREKSASAKQKEAVQEEEKDKNNSDSKNEEDVQDIRMSITGAHEDLGDYYKLSTAGATASSVIQQESTDNSAGKAIDGSEKTSWQEGASGEGIGESLKIELADTYKVKYLALQLGNWNSQYYYDGNNRPKELQIRVGDVTQTVTFPDGKREYWVELSEECSASDVELTIQSVYKGTEWDDTCIAEVGVYGRSNIE